MTLSRKQATQWAVDNLPHWPKVGDKPPRERPHGWTWQLVDGVMSQPEANGYYLVNMQTGESIGNTEYFKAKDKPSGKSFSELIQWAKEGCTDV